MGKMFITPDTGHWEHLNIYEQAVGASNVYGGRQGQKLMVTWVANVQL